MSEKEFQIAIVGAGIAGSSCAQVLGEGGANVVIFDDSHPREKPCGGFIEDRVVEELSIPQNILENEIKWGLTERFGIRTKFLFKPSHFLTSRKNFDYYLLQKAQINKNVLFVNERVEHIVKKKNTWMVKTNKGKTVEARFLVGADGCPSFVRKQIYKPIPKEFLAVALGYEMPCPKDYLEKNFAKNTIEIYYSRRYLKKPGFIWIFPKKASINIGIGSRETGSILKEALDNFISAHPAGKRVKDLERRFFLGLIPQIYSRDFFDLPCSGENWALIGDAAGHVNPVNGAGIYYAIKGGKLCGNALLEGDIRLFEDYWRDDYGVELSSAARLVSDFYGGPGFVLWFSLLSRNFAKRVKQSFQ